MYTLEIFDLRTEEELKTQANELKNNLIDMLNGHHFDVNDIEEEVVDFIKNNRVHYSHELTIHESLLGITFPTEDNCVGKTLITVIKHSLNYRHLLFKLMYKSSKSSNSYDAVVTYIKDGKSQRCPTKIVVEDFDEKKLI